MNDEPAMSFGNHLEELRRRILISLLAAGIAFAVIYAFFSNYAIELLRRPFNAAALEGMQLHTLSVAEIFVVTIKISLIGAVLISSPIIIYQMWAFISPGLREKERRLVLPVAAAGVVMFAVGVVVCYAFVLPVLFNFFINMNVQAGTAMTWQMSSVIDTQLLLLVAFGAGFEGPLVILVLSHLGLVTPEILAAKRKYVILLLLIASAMITPPDALTMIMLAAPLYVLYELSILVILLVRRRKAKST